MIIDKLGKPVQTNNRIAIAELKLNDQLVKSAHLVFATVIKVFSDYLIIRYDNNMIDDNFISEEFIIISTLEEKITYIGSSLEMPLGYSNVK